VQNTPKILVIESPTHPLDDLSGLLQRNGYALEHLQNGDEAVKIMLEHPDKYAIVVVDYRTSESDSGELVTKMHANSDLKTIPLIMIVPNTERDTLRHALQRGTHYCLSDDFSPEHILTVIQAAVRRNLSYRQLLSTAPHVAYPMMKYLVSGDFEVKTLSDVQDLAHGLASVCPNPNLAIVGISELLINAIEHGNLAITYEEKSQYKKDNIWEEKISARQKEPQHAHKIVKVHFTRTPTDFMIRIEDQGAGFDSTKFMNLSPERLLDTHGRGIMMAKSLVFKELTFSPKGNVVTCVIPRQLEPIPEPEKRSTPRP
jgi:DNA-binding response OmpR family regulator